VEGVLGGAKEVGEEMMIQIVSANEPYDPFSQTEVS
jgi:hypothetical protein